jgi:hypothetical protein
MSKRDGPPKGGKKNATYYLPVETIAGLETLAAAGYTKPSRVIERLVNEELAVRAGEEKRDV